MVRYQKNEVPGTVSGPEADAAAALSAGKRPQEGHRECGRRHKNETGTAGGI